MGRVRRAAAMVSLLQLLPACFEPSQEVLEELEATKRATDDAITSLNQLEERFLYNQSNVMMWRELASRHRKVSAVACENAATHAKAIVRFQERQAEKATRVTRRERVRKQAPVSEAVGSPLTSGSGEPTAGAW